MTTKFRGTQARVSKNSRRDIIARAHRLFGRLGEEETRYVLVHLAEENPEMVGKVKRLQREFSEVLRERMTGVDMEEVAKGVLADLNSLDPESVWDASGPDRHGGYYDPGDCSWDTLSDEMDGHTDYVKDLWKEGLREDAAAYCLGVLKGVATFYLEGRSEAREWFGEDSHTYAENLLEEWNKITKGGKWLRWVLDRIPQTLPPRFLDHFHPERET